MLSFSMIDYFHFLQIRHYAFHCQTLRYFHYMPDDIARYLAAIDYYAHYTPFRSISFAAAFTMPPPGCCHAAFTRLRTHEPLRSARSSAAYARSRQQQTIRSRCRAASRLPTLLILIYFRFISLFQARCAAVKEVMFMLPLLTRVKRSACCLVLLRARALAERTSSISFFRHILLHADYIADIRPLTIIFRYFRFIIEGFEFSPQHADPIATPPAPLSVLPVCPSDPPPADALLSPAFTTQ